jgi:O-antigen/teichoic acid export membrane protein
MFVRYSKINFSILVGLMIIAFLVSDWVIPIVYGDEFFQSSLMFKILLPGVLFSCQTKLLASYIISFGKQQYNLIATIVGFVVNLILNILLISSFGIIGASIASSFTYFAIFVVVTLYSHFRLGLPFVNYFFLSLPDIKKLFDERKSIIKKFRNN